MDPNVTLRDLREVMAEFADSAPDSNERALAASEMAVHIADLDEWLTKGGFLPTDWQPKVEEEPAVYSPKPGDTCYFEGDNMIHDARCGKYPAGTITSKATGRIVGKKES